jgi:hypothetical protein
MDSGAAVSDLLRRYWRLADGRRALSAANDDKIAWTYCPGALDEDLGGNGRFEISILLQFKENFLAERELSSQSGAEIIKISPPQHKQKDRLAAVSPKSSQAVRVIKLLR